MDVQKLRTFCPQFKDCFGCPKNYGLFWMSHQLRNVLNVQNLRTVLDVLKLRTVQKLRTVLDVIII